MQGLGERDCLEHDSRRCKRDNYLVFFFCHLVFRSTVIAAEASESVEARCDAL